MTRLLSDTLDQHLTIQEYVQVRVHLPTCSGCRQYRRQIVLLRTAARVAAGEMKVARDKHTLKWNKKWPTGFDLNVQAIGSSKEPGIHSGTVNATCDQYAKSRS
ncbi:hypothetical protein ABIC51_006860 [Burkholderia sp. 572]